MEKREKKKKYDIFISYRRDGGEFTAKILRDRLQEMGYRVFFDVETLRSGDFNKDLYDVIDGCTDFLLVLSPKALDRCVNEGDWVRYEVERALLKGKNIVPVMLKDFDFPETLPPSLEPLRYKNGLVASSQFFDAFIETLQEYLQSVPKKRVLLKAAAAVLAAAVVCAGLFFLLRPGDTAFPHTSEEKSVTEEVLYYVENNLTRLDMMLSAANDALENAGRYVTAGTGAYSTLDAAFDVSMQSLENCDLETCAPSDGLIQRVGALDDMPFSPADLVGMHDAAVESQRNWLGNLSHILWAVGKDSYIAPDAQLALVDNYQSLLEEEMKLNAYNVNELLLPVTDRSALDDFFNTYLPMLKSIPLSASSWSTDLQAILADEEASDNRQTQLLIANSAMVGNMTMDNAALRESLIRTYEALGLTREQAQEQVELWMEYVGLLAEYDGAIQQLRAEPDDGWDVLWIKLQSLMYDGEYDYALECVDALDTLMAGDADAAEYLPALRRFIGSVGETGVNYGAMVMAWEDPEHPNEVFQIGDVVIAVNGEPCRNYQEYNDLKQALDGDTFTVTVLRDDGRGGLAPVDLALDKDMPRVYLNDMTFVDEEQ